MNLIYFIKLILKNVILIGAVAVFMAILVFLMTRNQEKTYSSDMVIYTGLATGYDIESGSDSKYDHFGTNAKFDLLINIIKSRKTLEETAIRLMTQHLMLEQPQSIYCTRETWDAINKEVPREVKSLIHYQNDLFTGKGYDLPGRQTDAAKSSNTPKEDSLKVLPQTVWVTKTIMKSEMVAEKVRKGQSEPKYYKVRAGDYPLEIAKRNGLSLEQLIALNKAEDFPLHGGQSICVGQVGDEYYIDSLVEKLVPFDTLVEEFVDSLGDFGGYMDVEQEGEEEFSQAQINPIDQMDSIAQNFDHIYDEALSQVQAFERSVANLIKYKEKDESNYIYTTLQSSNPVYGVQKISRIKASRMQNSDLLKLSFESNDQGVCQQTLMIITEVFKKQYQSIKGAQTSMVSDYFRRQRDAAKARLDTLEEYNKKYRMEHSIINYNEQTKFISEQNELLDQSWYDESATLSSAKAALTSLESKMDDYSQNLIQRADLLNLRSQLSRLTHLLSIEEVQVNPDIEKMTKYRQDKEQVQVMMDKVMNDAFQSKRTTEGINMETILSLWLGEVVKVEESKARYDVIKKHKQDYLAKYDRFAPLGSELTKIERQIGLAEQEYLTRIHSLDLSLMKQKSNEQSNIQTLDEPYFPIKPRSSKRMITVIAAFMAGLFLTTAAIILLEFIDTSIKFPERAEELTKSKLIGAFPKIPKRPDKQINYPLITSRLIDMASQKIKLEELKRPPSENPFMILLISTRQQEGKSFIASKLVEKFRAVGHRVLYIKPFEQAPQEEFEDQFKKSIEENQSWDFEYEIPDNFMSIGSVNELLRNYTFMTRGYHYIFVELPALLSSDYPAALAASADLSLLVCRATRTWNKADDEVLDIYKTNSKQTVFSLINGVQVDNLESIIGEIPRSRSFIRSLMKKVVNLDLNFTKRF